VYGFEYEVSATVTDQQLRKQLQKEVDEYNYIYSLNFRHEFKHAENAPYMSAIRESKSDWKACFLDETSANLAHVILLRKNMLDEYAKQLQLAGGNPQQINFNAVSYLFEKASILPEPEQHDILIWYDSKNNFAELMTGVSQEEAIILMSSLFNFFCTVFDRQIDIYRNPINRAFDNKNYIKTSFDTDEFFQKTLNAYFTYKIGDKDVNLLEVMGAEARAEFLAKLEAKMNQEYARWSGQ
jgi:hypothetical protein